MANLSEKIAAYLAANGILANSVDWNTGQPEGEDDQILVWDSAKLGPQPTQEQLDAAYAAQQLRNAAIAAATQAYSAAIEAGLTLTSKSDPTLNGTYACDKAAQDLLTATATGLAAGLGLPGGGTTMIWNDLAGGGHAVTAAQFVEIAVAIRNYVYALFLFATGHGPLPSNSVTIA